MGVATDVETKSNEFPKGDGIEKRVLVAFLRPYFEAKDTDTIITYEMISEKLGRDITDTNRSPLNAAERQLEREYDLNMITVRTVGVKIATPDEALQDADRRNDRVRRQVGRNYKRALRIDPKTLEHDDDRKKLATIQTVAGVLRAASSSSSRKKIEAVIQPSKEVIPPAKAIASMFK